LKPLPEGQVILSDARDLDPGEREAVDGSQLAHLGDVTALLDFRLPEGPLWVHFDTDVVDAGESPAMSYPVAGGPSVADMRQVFRRLAETGRVVAVSLSSWNPDLDGVDKSEEVSMSLLSDLID
jgi:arginase